MSSQVAHSLLLGPLKEQSRWLDLHKESKLDALHTKPSMLSLTQDVKSGCDFRDKRVMHSNFDFFEMDSINLLLNE